MNVIVAIPSQDDYVWNVSSEKIPHLTLLALGDNLDNVSGITDFLEHVANTSMDGFGLEVDRRGELGDQKADVLFFGNHGIEKLNEIRYFLLTNPDIYKAHNAIKQFPEWIPHLTLGFPETPAKPDKRDFPGFSWMNFDRIALWTGDFEGPEFLLKDRFNSLSMSANVDEVLEHFGVKGMQWGVRRSLSARSAARQAARSEDSRNASAAISKGKKTGLHSLSNKELQDMVTRMNLEQQYSRIAPPGKLKMGLKIAKGILTAGKTVNDVLAFSNSPAGKMLKQQLSHVRG